MTVQPFHPRPMPPARKHEPIVSRIEPARVDDFYGVKLFMRQFYLYELPVLTGMPADACYEQMLRDAERLKTGASSLYYAQLNQDGGLPLGLLITHQTDRQGIHLVGAIHVHRDAEALWVTERLLNLARLDNHLYSTGPEALLGWHQANGFRMVHFDVPTATYHFYDGDGDVEPTCSITPSPEPQLTEADIEFIRLLTQ